MFTDMKRLLLSLSLPLVACYGGERRNTGECPAGETCSTLTPDGLDFVGNRLVGELLLSGPRPTAIGGTQAIALEYNRGDGVDVALDLPFTADDNGGQGIKVASISGSQVTVRGAGSFSNYLRILDDEGLLLDRKELTGAALTEIELITADYEKVPAGAELAFASGARKVGIALYGDVQTSGGPSSQRIIDTSMALDFPGANRASWDTLEINATPGTFFISATAGGKPPAALDFIVVDHADSVTALADNPGTIKTSSSTSVCFQALSGTRYIAGLTWTYNVDGQVTTKGNDDLTRNCVSVTTAKVTGTVSISATAGGQTTAMALTVATARELPTEVATPTNWITTAGDRASM
jgi:hypothetical protein